tara:strand:- start:1580 stop:1798 length:219 start_codon:yes stop_codon:yes gene_type:complete
MKEQVYETNALLLMIIVNVVIFMFIITEFIPMVYGIGIILFGLIIILFRTKRQLRQCEWRKIWEIPKDGKNK